MASAKTVATRRKFYTVEEANKALPLVRVIVEDIVRQLEVVNDLRSRLTALSSRRRPIKTDDPYQEELNQFKAELEAEEARLREFVDELDRLGVLLKGTDGLCDFPSLRDGREVYLCWRLGEPEVMYWHELDAGFPGRQPVKIPTPTRPAAQPLG